MEVEKTYEELIKENLTLAADNQSLNGERDALREDNEKLKRELEEARLLNSQLYLRITQDSINEKETPRAEAKPLSDVLAEYINKESKNG